MVGPTCWKLFFLENCWTEFHQTFGVIDAFWDMSDEFKGHRVQWVDGCRHTGLISSFLIKLMLCKMCSRFDWSHFVLG